MMLLISKNLSRLISQLTLLIPKFVTFDFPNDTFDFQNLLRLISQMAFLISKMRHMWMVSPTQGRGDTQSMVTSRPNKAARVF